jgi:tripartite-type tricarboxylate transporter receptor subunit TctC
MVMNRFVFAVLGLAFALSAGGAGAQTWPQRPVRIVVPYAAGGNTDGIARVIAAKLSQSFDQQFVVENRPGANGIVATELVVNAAPDGYTLLMSTVGQVAVNPAMTKVTFDPLKDLAPVSNVASNPFVLAIYKDVPAKNLQEFVAYVKAHPGELSYGSGGVGSIGHLSSALFAKRAGLDMSHAAYRGGGPAVADLVGGHIPMYFANQSEVAPYEGQNVIRLIAVSSLKRSPKLPGVPTVAEQGYPGFETLTWNGLMAPAKTSPEIIERVASATAKAVHDPAVLERFAAYGVDPIGNTPAEFAAEIRKDIPLWGEAVKISGARLD